ncbi:MAG TPA: hypothetical protein VGO22_07650 [Pseudorhizobium sp.]|nr:hypothetical protein [Pseudorhizobium sp.]
MTAGGALLRSIRLYEKPSLNPHHGLQEQNCEHLPLRGLGLLTGRILSESRLVDDLGHI